MSYNSRYAFAPPGKSCITPSTALEAAKMGRDPYTSKMDVAEDTTAEFRKLLIEIFDSLDNLPSAIHLFLKSMPFLLTQGVTYTLDQHGITQITNGTPNSSDAVRLPPFWAEVRVEFGKVFVGDHITDVSQ